mmetsp:Transcript_14712/g.12945  ORF Transcript_14712/g.12945 Transcript_14712/m.12945 type:complete len:144 (-) Transcript_14712:524-955(-)
MNKQVITTTTKHKFDSSFKFNKRSLISRTRYPSRIQISEKKGEIHKYKNLLERRKLSEIRSRGIKLDDMHHTTFTSNVSEASLNPGLPPRSPITSLNNPYFKHKLRTTKEKEESEILVGADKNITIESNNEENKIPILMPKTK